MGFRFTHLIAAFVALCLGYSSFEYTAAVLIRSTNPELAYRLRPDDPGAIAAALNARITKQNDFKPSDDDIRNLKASLKRAPLNRVLLRTLGVKAELDGRRDLALKAMALSDLASRRDSITQLWLGEHFKREQKFEISLRHYDAAMEVKPAIRNVLIPQLVPLLDQRRFRASVRGFLIDGSSWGPPFLDAAVSSDISLSSYLVEPILQKLNDGVYNAAIGKLIHGLALQGESKRALSFAGKAIPEFKLHKFRELRWNPDNQNPRLGALAWSFPQNDGVMASSDTNGQLEITTSPLATGIAVTRDLMVSDGESYRFDYSVSGDAARDSTQLWWTVDCFNRQSEIKIWESDEISAVSTKSFRSTLYIPRNCNLIRLAARVRGSDSQLPSGIKLNSISLVVD
jgi:hypothetical protein